MCDGQLQQREIFTDHHQRSNFESQHRTNNQSTQATPELCDATKAIAALNYSPIYITRYVRCDCTDCVPDAQHNCELESTNEQISNSLSNRVELSSSSLCLVSLHSDVSGTCHTCECAFEFIVGAIRSQANIQCQRRQPNGENETPTPTTATPSI